tara:strand:+ start:906 stop:1028 length:123 start_codon:yes stop_codon:yes gene_type:complete
MVGADKFLAARYLVAFDQTRSAMATDIEENMNYPFAIASD